MYKVYAAGVGLIYSGNEKIAKDVFNHWSIRHSDKTITMMKGNNEIVAQWHPSGCMTLGV